MEKYVSTKEWMAYAVGALGQGMVYAIMSSYISDFYLSVLKLTPIFVSHSEGRGHLPDPALKGGGGRHGRNGENAPLPAGHQRPYPAGGEHRHNQGRPGTYGQRGWDPVH